MEQRTGEQESNRAAEVASGVFLGLSGCALALLLLPVVVIVVLVVFVFVLGGLTSAFGEAGFVLGVLVLGLLTWLLSWLPQRKRKGTGDGGNGRES